MLTFLFLIPLGSLQTVSESRHGEGEGRKRTENERPRCIQVFLLLLGEISLEVGVVSRARSPPRVTLAFPNRAFGGPELGYLLEVLPYSLYVCFGMLECDDGLHDGDGRCIQH